MILRAGAQCIDSFCCSVTAKPLWSLELAASAVVNVDIVEPSDGLFRKLHMHVDAGHGGRVSCHGDDRFELEPHDVL